MKKSVLKEFISKTKKETPDITKEQLKEKVLEFTKTQKLDEIEIVPITVNFKPLNEEINKMCGTRIPIEFSLENNNPIQVKCPNLSDKAGILENICKDLVIRKVGGGVDKEKKVVMIALAFYSSCLPNQEPFLKGWYEIDKDRWTFK